MQHHHPLQWGAIPPQQQQQQQQIVYTTQVPMAQQVGSAAVDPHAFLFSRAGHSSERELTSFIPIDDPSSLHFGGAAPAMPPVHSGVTFASLLGQQNSHTIVRTQAPQGYVVLQQHAVPPSPPNTAPGHILMSPPGSGPTSFLQLANNSSQSSAASMFHGYAQNSSSGHLHMVQSQQPPQYSFHAVSPLPPPPPPQQSHFAGGPPSYSAAQFQGGTTHLISSQSVHQQFHLSGNCPTPHHTLHTPHSQQSTPQGQPRKRQKKPKRVLTPRSLLAKETRERNEQDKATKGGRPFAEEPVELDVNKKQLIINFVSQLVTDEEFHAIFAQFGEVSATRIIYDKHTHRSKGYGFVYFKKGEDAIEAIKKLNGFDVYAKLLKVGYASPQRPTPPSTPRGMNNAHTPEDDEDDDEDALNQTDDDGVDNDDDIVDESASLHASGVILGSVNTSVQEQAPE